MSDPVYLVSRCSTVEEFVAAFRRYADRLGVFVPVAAPVSVGRKARFAITLKDGGVVVEGDAEVIMSSSRAAGLHGRPGMTLRFANVDDDSRAVLDHLDKVRFGAKVTLPSNHLVVRPGPTPPSDLGPPPVVKPGTDPAQILAECVVVGDAAPTPAASVGSGGSGGGPSTASPARARPPGSVPPPVGAAGSQRFAIPAIVPRTGPMANIPATPAASAPAVKPKDSAASVAPSTSSTPSAAASVKPNAPPSAPELGFDVSTEDDEPAPPPPATAKPEPPDQWPRSPASPAEIAVTRAPARPLSGVHRPTMMGAAVADPRLPGPNTMPHAVPTDGVPATAASASGAVTVAGGAATVPMSSPMSSPPAPPEAVPIETPFLRNTTRGVAPPGVHEIEMGPPMPVGRGSPPPGDKVMSAATPATVPQAHAVPEPPVLPAEPARRPQPPKSKTMMGIQAIVREPAAPSSPELKIPTEMDEPTAPIAAVPVPPPGAPAPAPLPAAAVGVPALRDLAAAAAAPAATRARPPSSIEIDPSLLEPTDAQPIVDPTAPAAGGNGASDDGEVAVVSQPWPPPDAPAAVAATRVPAPPIVPPTTGAAPAWTKAAGHPAPAPGEQIPNVRAVTDADTGFFQDTGPQDRISERGVGYLTDANTGFFQETGAQQSIGYGTDDMTAMVHAPPGKKRLLVIVVSCIAVFVLGFVGILVFGAKKRPGEAHDKPPAVAKGSAAAVTGSGSGGGSVMDQAIAPPVETGSATAPVTGSATAPVTGSATAPVTGSATAPVTGSATAPATGSGTEPATGSGTAPATGSGTAPATGSGTAPATGSGTEPPTGDGSDDTGGDDTGPAPPPDGATKIGTGECKVKVTSTPSGSEVVVAGKTRGRTPLDLAITCASTQIAVRRSHYTTYTKTVKPSKKKTVKVSARLGRQMFTVKVSSVPSGATVLVNGKRSGKTPTAVKVPGFAATTITLTKDGYANQSERVTAKQNGTAIRMTLHTK